MSIQNELTSDIAVALLERGGNDPERLKEMKELIFRVHATLQKKLPHGKHKSARREAAAADRNNQLRRGD